MKKHLKIFNTYSSSAGFTLIELLVAASVSTLVVTACGYGLTTMMKADKNTEAQSSRRIELNRALDFMAEEVRAAKSISTHSDIDVHSAQAPNFPSDCDNSGDGVDCGLILEVPGVNQRVIYYVQSPLSGSPWLGPRVIYRWGPNFDASGNYTNATSPASWTTEPVVDQIEGNLNSPWHTNCPSGWSPKLNDPTRNPDDRDSFYACVEPTTTESPTVYSPTGRVTQIYLLGQLKDAYGENNGHLEVKTRVFARSAP